eukprot:scaffold5259_cov120-Cylindrotheca_fusiformis.AAC.4
MNKSSLFVITLSVIACQCLAAVCPTIERDEDNTRLKSNDPHGPDFTEVSGVAFSPRQTYHGKPIFFAIGDGGADSRIGMFDSDTGRRLRTLRVDRDYFRNGDWESISIGSCGRSGRDKTCLYITDAGDNKARKTGGRTGRDDYKILKIREPDLDDYDDNDMIPKSRMSRLDFDYRHSSSPTNHADCEAVFLDHKGWGEDEDVGGEFIEGLISLLHCIITYSTPFCFSILNTDLYLATKWDGDDHRKNRLFRIPADAWSSDFDGSTKHYSPRTVGDYDYNDYRDRGGTHIMKTTWTSAEMSFDGTLIALGNLQKEYIWLRCPGTSIVDALVNSHRDTRACLDFKHASSGQSESFAFTPDGRYGLNVPEGDSPRMGFTKFSYNRDKSDRVCEDDHREPTREPTRDPTRRPTPEPTPGPTHEPTPEPTREPTRDPTPGPTGRPTPGPTRAPSVSPSIAPSDAPTSAPTSCDGHQLRVTLETGNNAGLTSWQLLNGESLVAEGSGYGNNTVVEIDQCVGAGVHTFKVSNPLVDGVPGEYKITYDDDVLYDSRGAYGSLKEVSFTAGDGFIDPSNSPTVSPTKAPATELPYGSVCQGVCPSGKLVNPNTVVEYSGGVTYECRTLHERYQMIFATPDACDSLARAAQKAGCQCSTTSETNKPIVVEKEDKVSDEMSDSSIWLTAVLVLACLLCIVAFVGFCAKRRREKRILIAEGKFGDDKTSRSSFTQRSGSAGSRSVASSTGISQPGTEDPVVEENDDISVASSVASTSKAILSTSMGSVGNYLQSWKLILSGMSDEESDPEEDEMPMSV